MNYTWTGCLLGIALLFLGSCSKEYSIARGTIEEDRRYCGCCGGYLVQVDEETTYQFFEEDLPAGNTALEGVTFPVEVELHFESKGDYCTGNDRISIQSIRVK